MGCVSYLNFSSGHTDFGCGFMLFGRFAGFGNMFMLFLMLVLGLKVLYLVFNYNGLHQIFDGFRGKSVHLKNGFSSSIDVCGICYSKISSSKFDLLELVDNCVPDLKKPAKIRALCSVRENCSEVNESFEQEEEEEEVGDDFEEDEEMDVVALRRAVRTERRRAGKACSELEEERLAAASAADEAMAMILRLQNDLSTLRIHANQEKRLAEQKQLHDREVIHHLQWIILKHESERSILESQLGLCRRKLKLYLKAEEEDDLQGIDWTRSCLGSLSDAEGLISSLDMESESG